MVGNSSLKNILGNDALLQGYLELIDVPALLNHSLSILHLTLLMRYLRFFF